MNSIMGIFRPVCQSYSPWLTRIIIIFYHVYTVAPSVFYLNRIKRNTHDHKLLHEIDFGVKSDQKFSNITWKPTMWSNIYTPAPSFIHRSKSYVDQICMPMVS